MPLSIDFERGYGDTPATVRRLSVDPALGLTALAYSRTLTCAAVNSWFA